jgi:hypothetical protein
MLDVTSNTFQNIKDKVFMVITRIGTVQNLQEDLLNEHLNLRFQMLSEINEDPIED